VILLGGSALSPWAVQRDPLAVKRRVADDEKIKCPGDVEADDIAPCLRLKSLEELLAVQLDPPRFTSGFAPFADGAVLPPTVNQVRRFSPIIDNLQTAVTRAVSTCFTICSARLLQFYYAVNCDTIN